MQYYNIIICWIFYVIKWPITTHAYNRLFYLCVAEKIGNSIGDWNEILKNIGHKRSKGQKVKKNVTNDIDTMNHKNRWPTWREEKSNKPSLLFVSDVLWRCLSRHNRPPTKNVRPSKTEEERDRWWRMVHSGPFNDLCEIESSRGSPGISNIFLLMLQLLRITPSPTPLLISSYLLPQFLPLPSYVYHLTKTTHTLIVTNLCRNLKSSYGRCERISEFPWPKKHKWTHVRNVEFFRPRIIPYIIFLT